MKNGYSDATKLHTKTDQHWLDRTVLYYLFAMRIRKKWFPIAEYNYACTVFVNMEWVEENRKIWKIVLCVHDTMTATSDDVSDYHLIMHELSTMNTTHREIQRPCTSHTHAHTHDALWDGAKVTLKRISIYATTAFDFHRKSGPKSFYRFSRQSSFLVGVRLEVFSVIMIHDRFTP